MTHERCPKCRRSVAVRAHARTVTCGHCGARSAVVGHRSNPGGGDVATRKYERFHGVEPQRQRTLNVTLPDEWWTLGKAVKVQYAPAARSERGDSIWDHDFGVTTKGRHASRAQIYASPDGRFILIHGGFTVSPDVGING